MSITLIVAGHLIYNPKISGNKLESGLGTPNTLLMFATLFIEHLPESPTNAHPQTMLQIQPIIRKTMVDSCIMPTKQLTHKMEVRFMSGRSRRVRKKATRPDITVPEKTNKQQSETFTAQTLSFSL